MTNPFYLALQEYTSVTRLRVLGQNSILLVFLLLPCLLGLEQTSYESQDWRPLLEVQLPPGAHKLRQQVVDWVRRNYQGSGQAGAGGSSKYNLEATECCITQVGWSYYTRRPNTLIS